MGHYFLVPQMQLTGVNYGNRMARPLAPVL